MGAIALLRWLAEDRILVRRNDHSLQEAAANQEIEMKLENLHDVLVDVLRDLYNAEKQLIRALPRMAKAANSPELRSALEEHLAVTEKQATRLEAVFEELDLSARGKTCHGMQGIIEEGKEVLESRKGSCSEAVDAAIIAAAQKVEHYEMSGYGSCRAHAQALGLSRVASLLQQTLDEESAANESLTRIAEAGVNAAAAMADGQSSRSDESF